MRYGAAFVILLLSCTLLGGCAQDIAEKEKERKVGPPLTAKQVQRALLTKQDLGRKFVLDKSPGGDDDTKLGCLDKIDTTAKGLAQPLREREIEFEAKTTVGAPGVSAFVGTYRSETAASGTLALLLRRAKSCRSVSVSDDGVRLRLSVGATTLALATAADEQLTFTASGSLSGPGGSLPIISEFTLVRMGRHLVGVSMTDLAETLQGARADLTDAAMDRLVAVVDGKQLPKPKAVLADYPLVSPKDLQPSL